MAAAGASQTMRTFRRDETRLFLSPGEYNQMRALLVVVPSLGVICKCHAFNWLVLIQAWQQRALAGSF